MKSALRAADSSVYSVSSEAVMNGSWQKERHTVVQALARDTETILSATVANMNERFAAVKAETDALKTELAKLHEAQRIGAVVRIEQRQDLDALLAWQDRGWRGRWRWLLRGI